MILKIKPRQHVLTFSKSEVRFILGPRYKVQVDFERIKYDNLRYELVKVRVGKSTS